MNSFDSRKRGDMARAHRAALLAAGLVALLAGLPGCAPEAETAATAEVPRNVRVLTASPTDVGEYFEISGALAPVRGADISAEETGVVHALPVDKGAEVAEDQALIELDRRLLAAELAAAEANLELQDYNVEKTRELFEAGKVSRIQLLEAEALAEQARAQASVGRLRHDRAAVKAPFDGIVTDRYVELGQLVVPGQPVARVVDPYTLKLQGALSESEVAWVEVGAPTRIFLEDYARSVEGRVHWVGFEADPFTGKFKVEVHIDNGDLRLRGGVVGRARVHKTRHDGVLALPRDAIMLTDAGPAVYVVEGDRARLRDVELGPDQGVMVVLESGLAAGEQVVVRGHRELVDGALVKVTGEAERADGSTTADPRVVTDAESRSRRPAGEEVR